jgi:hypothetical protein
MTKRLDPAAIPAMMPGMSILRAASLLLSLACAAPLAAQTITPRASPTLAADRAQLSICLRQSGGAPASCIGTIAVACVAAASTGRREAESGCARREEAAWRERLGQALAIVGRSLDSGRQSRLASLQLAWEGFIAQKCAFYGASQSEALQVGRQAGCELREVAERAIELERAMPRQPQRPPQGPPQIIR